MTKKKNDLSRSEWWMDGWVRVLHPFNSISVISRRRKGEPERLCAMKHRLGSGWISPPGGFEPATPWSKVGSTNRSAMRTLHALNINRWKGSVKPCPFIGLLILNLINRFIFGHGVVIYYTWVNPVLEIFSIPVFYWSVLGKYWFIFKTVSTHYWCIFQDTDQNFKWSVSRQ